MHPSELCLPNKPTNQAPVPLCAVQAASEAATRALQSATAQWQQRESDLRGQQEAALVTAVAAHQQALELLRAEHASTLADQLANASAAHGQSEAGFRAQLQAMLKEEQERARQEADTLRAAHATALAQLTQRLQEELQEARTEAAEQLSALSQQAQCAGEAAAQKLQHEIARLTNLHEAAVSKLVDSHAAEVQALQAQAKAAAAAEEEKDKAGQKQVEALGRVKAGLEADKVSVRMRVREWGG